MDKQKLDNLRHSCAHLLAAAVIDLWPKALRTIGPAIEDGFYYDFDFGKDKISEADLPKIEEKMHKILEGWDKFEGREVNKQEAEKLYKGNPYKLELIDEFVKEDQKLSIYKSGDYEDLCRGGHTDKPKEDLKHFKLLSIAGAYWRGDPKKAMLTRIYGTCFPSKEELDKHLENLEKAKERDHRKIGKELELFTISEEVGQGLVLWLPKGTVIREELEAWAKETEKAWGYQRVSTPHITKSGLYYTSGHLPYYKKDMYPPMKVDDTEEYYLKPMNCPHHHMVYASSLRSYKELPLRLAEYGMVYRYEASGELFGMMRVRGIAQNDAHIYCTEEQAVDEFVSVMKLHEYYYKTLGITDYHLELALRDPKNKEKYHGDEGMWKRAEELMRKAVSKLNIKMVEQIGNAAFYGPKIDFIIHSSIGREFGISTNQIDLYMGSRFGLKYIDNDGREKTPVIIHRAPLGSHERFVGFLIEHWGGAFPVWLSPVQVVLLPIADKNLNYAKKLKQELSDKGIRVELEDANETLSAKIRRAQLEKIPYMAVLGEKEENSKSVSLRLRNGEDLGQVPVDKFVQRVEDYIREKKLDL
jgi:threonyl-tRNA synthetase